MTLLPHIGWQGALIALFVTLFALCLVALIIAEVRKARRTAWGRLRHAREAYGPRQPHHSTKRNNTESVTH